jgi:hypothetical protein
LERVVIIVDNILVFGKSREEHNYHLSVVLDKFRKKNIKPNTDELVVESAEVQYLVTSLVNKAPNQTPKRFQTLGTYIPLRRMQNWKLF